MTYQTSPQNFSTASAMPKGFARTALSKIASFFRSVGHSFITASEACARVDQIEALQAKTDEELAAMGLRRDQIVHHVFRDLYYC